MCGIAGVFSNSNLIDDTKLRNAIDILGHRGPDNKQTWISETKKVELAHARPSIIDIEGGTNPKVFM